MLLLFSTLILQAQIQHVCEFVPFIARAGMWDRCSTIAFHGSDNVTNGDCCQLWLEDWLPDMFHYKAVFVDTLYTFVSASATYWVHSVAAASLRGVLPLWKRKAKSLPTGQEAAARRFQRPILSQCFPPPQLQIK